MMRSHEASARGTRRRSRRRARTRGFTIVEVIVAMGVMVLGMMGIFALQKQTLLANSIGRQRAIAHQIAQTWIEYLKQDALINWTQAGETEAGPPAAQVIAPTAWLSAVNVLPGVFQQIPASAVQDQVSNAFDFRGDAIRGGVRNGVVPAGTSPWFCVSFRPQWVYLGRALRVDVRVFWPRPQSGNVVVDCVDPAPNAGLPNQFMSVYLSTVLKYTAL